MMDIVMLVAGAGVGAMLRDLFVLHRGGEGKTRQQLESKSPYDHALTNAIAERDRLRDELVTLRAISNVQTDTERIRNEIDTILSEDGEESSESVYEHNIGMPIRDNGDGTFSPITWDNRISAEEMVDNISKAFAKAYGTNVREDDTEDERMAEESEERSLTKAVRDSFESKEIIQVEWRGSCGSLRVRCGIVDEIATGDGKVKEFGIRGLEIFARDVLRITKGDDINGETLYRKGNR